MKAFIPLLIAMTSLVSSLIAEDSVGMTAQETFHAVTDTPDQVLFLDVREPVEIMFTGFTDLVDTNIPFLLVDRNRWNKDKGTFQMNRNPDFISHVEDALNAKGLGRDATIITMCRSGSARGLPSAAFLRENGFPNATYVIHGFQGDRVGEGPQKGRRVKNGWVNDGFPWSTKANPEKIYRPGEASRSPWLVIITSDSRATQAMALILSRAERERHTPIRILLCDEAGYLAVKDSSLEKAGHEDVEPLPRQLLISLLNENVDVQVCGIFLPTSDLTKDDLLPGVSPAKPNAISDEMGEPDTNVFVF